MIFWFWTITHLQFIQQQFFLIKVSFYCFTVYTLILYNQDYFSTQNQLINVFILCNIDSINNFQNWWFRIFLNVFSQSRIISTNRFFTNNDDKYYYIRILIYSNNQDKIFYYQLSFLKKINYPSSEKPCKQLLNYFH